MGWRPPDLNDIEALTWLGKIGLFAAIIDILRQFSTASSRLAWWQKIMHSLLIGLLTVGMGALLVSTWPTIPFTMLLGLASVGGYLGTDFIMWVSFRVLGSRRQGE